MLFYYKGESLGGGGGTLGISGGDVPLGPWDPGTLNLYQS